MKRRNGERALERRIRAGEVSRQDVTRRLAELAFGNPADCIRLVLEEHPELEGMDLSLIREVKRSEKGAVEVKLIDRIQALEQLSAVAREAPNGLTDLFQAMQDGEG